GREVEGERYGALLPGKYQLLPRGLGAGGRLVGGRGGRHGAPAGAARGAGRRESIEPLGVGLSGSKNARVRGGHHRGRASQHHPVVSVAEGLTMSEIREVQGEPLRFHVERDGNALKSGPWTFLMKEPENAVDAKYDIYY